jgi:hypothetical protein
MDHPITADSASRFEAYVEGLVSVIGHVGPCPAATGLLRWPDDAMRAQERRADGGGDRA